MCLLQTKATLQNFDFQLQRKILINKLFTFDSHSCPKYSNLDFQALKSLTKIKPSYKANIVKYCKTYQNKNLDKTRKRQGQKAIYKGIPQQL